MVSRSTVACCCASENKYKMIVGVDKRTWRFDCPMAAAGPSPVDGRRALAGDVIGESCSAVRLHWNGQGSVLDGQRTTPKPPVECDRQSWLAGKGLLSVQQLLPGTH